MTAGRFNGTANHSEDEDIDIEVNADDELDKLDQNDICLVPEN